MSASTPESPGLNSSKTSAGAFLLLEFVGMAGESACSLIPIAENRKTAARDVHRFDPGAGVSP